MGKERSKKALSEALEGLSKADLIKLVLRQMEEIELLRRRVEELERAKYRGAAPFRRDESKKVVVPKVPGQKPGHKGRYRKAPGIVDEVIDQGLDHCPGCGGELTGVKPVRQTCLRQAGHRGIAAHGPVRYDLTTYKGHCAKCGEVRSAYPLKTSEATGAAMSPTRHSALATARCHPAVVADNPQMVSITCFVLRLLNP